MKMAGIARSMLALIGCLAVAGPLLADTHAAPDSPRGRRLLVVASGGDDTNATESRPKASSEHTSDGQTIVYKPPRRGAALRRGAGGVRGGSKALPTPLALAPNHVALTARRAPSLFWHIDGTPPAGARVFFSITGPMEPKPLAEAELLLPEKAGIQRLRLEPLGIALEPDAEYEWFISLVLDVEQRDKDITSGGVIRLVRDTGIEERKPSAVLYAAHGFWYDALESVSDAIAAAPQDASLRAQRNSLLKQADLGAATE
jgi:hypothetical protein